MSDPVPLRRQRVAAYAVCVRDDHLLLAQLSHLTGWPGAWTLPGGGIDHGEEPRAAVVREVREETGLTVAVGALLDVDSVHFTGHAPDGTLEDYHSVRLLFAGDVADRAEPAVQEVDGSTMAAAWLSVEDVRSGRHEVVDLVLLALRLVGTEQPDGRPDAQPEGTG